MNGIKLVSFIVIGYKRNIMHFRSPIRMNRKTIALLPYSKLLCGGQGADMRAFLYMERSCFMHFIDEQSDFHLMYPYPFYYTSSSTYWIM